MLNRHCLAGNGFYGSVIDGRFFQARTTHGELEISDFDHWRKVTEPEAVFHDSNGENIPLY